MTVEQFDPERARRRERYARVHGRSPDCAFEDCPGCWPEPYDTDGDYGPLPCWPCLRDRTEALALP